MLSRVAHADEMLTAFLELERAIHQFAVSLMLKSDCVFGVTANPEIPQCRKTSYIVFY